MTRDQGQPSDVTVDQTTVNALLYRYGHLNEAHYQHNQVIHTTFYLSVVFFGSLLSIILTVDPTGSLVPVLSVFASIVFLLLGVWAWRYNHGREEIKKRKKLIQDEITNLNLEMNHGLEDTFFVRHDHTADPYKKVIHTAYYVTLAVGSVAAPLVLT